MGIFPKVQKQNFQKGNRFKAKCKGCDAVMIGKPQRMMKHLITVCKKFHLRIAQVLRA